MVTIDIDGFDYDIGEAKIYGVITDDGFYLSDGEVIDNFFEAMKKLRGVKK